MSAPVRPLLAAYSLYDARSSFARCLSGCTSLVPRGTKQAHGSTLRLYLTLSLLSAIRSDWLDSHPFTSIVSCSQAGLPIRRQRQWQQPASSLLAPPLSLSLFLHVSFMLHYVLFSVAFAGRYRDCFCCFRFLLARCC